MKGFPIKPGMTADLLVIIRRPQLKVRRPQLKVRHPQLDWGSQLALFQLCRRLWGIPDQVGNDGSGGMTMD
jgi:hypothetical protein